MVIRAFTAVETQNTDSQTPSQLRCHTHPEWSYGRTTSLTQSGALPGVGRPRSGLERTDGSKCWQTPDDMLLPVFAYLAARDFNARDGKYIPAFAGLGECDKRINITLADSREVGAGVVDTVLGSLAWQQLAVRYGGDQRSPLGPTWEDLSSLLAGQTSLHGVVGPGRSSQSMEIAPLTGALDILQLSYWDYLELERH